MASNQHGSRPGLQSIFGPCEKRYLSGVTASFGAGLKVKWWTDSQTAALESSSTSVDMGWKALIFGISPPRARILLSFSSIKELCRAQKVCQNLIIGDHKIHVEIVEDDELKVAEPKLLIKDIVLTASTIPALEDLLGHHDCHPAQVRAGHRAKLSSGEFENFISALLERESMFPDMAFETGIDQDFGPEADIWKIPSYRLITIFDNEYKPAQLVKALHDKKFAEMDFAKLVLWRSPVVQIMPSQDVMQYCKREVDELKAENQQYSLFPQVWISIPETLIRPSLAAIPSRVYLYAKSFKEMQAAVTRFRKIFNGHILCDGKIQLWHDIFLQPYGRKFLQDLCVERYGGVKIREDLRCLYSYGTLEQRENMEREIKGLLKERQSFYHTVPLRPTTRSATDSFQFHIAGMLFGQDRVEILDEIDPPEIRINVRLEHANLLPCLEFKAPLKNNPRRDYPSPVTTECAICLTEPEDPVYTRCRHVYCRECFLGRCNDALSRKDAITCCGGEGGLCEREFAIDDLREHVGSIELEKFFNASFQSYVRQNRQQLRYCPTPDCGDVYRCQGDDKRGFRLCYNCLAVTCMSCHADHAGTTCEAYRARHAVEVEEQRIFKEAHGVKDCPNCATSIQKADGCDHVICQSCRSHFCWICMAKFSTGLQTYDHIRSLHGITVYPGGQPGVPELQAPPPALAPALALAPPPALAPALDDNN